MKQMPVLAQGRCGGGVVEVLVRGGVALAAQVVGDWMKRRSCRCGCDARARARRCAAGAEESVSEGDASTRP